MWVVALVYMLVCVAALIVWHRVSLAVDRRRHTATVALDRIQTILDGNAWGPDTVDEIARVLRRTGREIRESDEYDLRFA